MKLAISNIAWNVDDEEVVAGILAESGADGVEIAPTIYWPAPCRECDAEAHECRQRWQRRGLPIVSLQALLFGMPHLKVFGTEPEQAATLDYLGRIFSLASVLGARTLVFGSPRNRDRGDRDENRALAEAKPFFLKLAQLAERVNVIMGLEPNPPQYQCNFLTTADATRRFVEELAHPNFRLHLDTGIMALNEEPIEATLEEAQPWLCSLHVSEPNLAPIGSCAVDHDRIGRHLRRIGYDGWVSIEMRSQPDRGQNLAAIRRALSLAREAYLAA